MSKFKEILIAFALVAVFAIFLSYKSGDIAAQFTGDENFYFQSSKNIVESGDWLTPRYYGKPRFQKPILYYWLVALSFKIFGATWFAARFFSVFFAALTAFLVYLIGGALFKERPLSLLAAFVLVTTFKFFKYARFAIPDMTLLFFVTLSFYVFLKITQKKNTSFLTALFFIITALATMVKGPVGLIIPLLSIALFVFLSKERPTVRRSDILRGALLYILITAPWFLAMLRIHGKVFISEVWTREVAQRLVYHSDTKTSASAAAEYLRTLFFYIPVLFTRFLPWSLFLPAGLLRAFKAGGGAGDSKDNPFILPLCWFFAVFVFFSLMGEKHSQYLLSLAPPFAIIVTANFYKSCGKRRLIMPFAIAFVTAAVFLGFFGNKNFRLNNAILGGFALKIVEAGLDDNARVAVGSHELIPQQLEVYLDRPVEKVGGKWYDAAYQKETSRVLLENFFNPRGKAYCIISKDDYLEFAPAGIKNRARILYSDFMWQRKIKITKDEIFLLLKGKIKIFLDNFKKEYYLVMTTGNAL